MSCHEHGIKKELNPHDELNLRPTDSAHQCSTQ